MISRAGADLDIVKIVTSQSQICPIHFFLTDTNQYEERSLATSGRYVR